MDHKMSRTSERRCAIVFENSDGCTEGLGTDSNECLNFILRQYQLKGLENLFEPTMVYS